MPIRRLTALVATLGCALPAAAAEPFWEPLAATEDGSLIEVDRSSLARREGLLTVWLRIDFAAPVRGRSQAYRSAVGQHTIDCAQRRHAAVRVTTYDGRLGHGDVIDRWDRGPEYWQWRSERSGPADAELIRLACGQAPAMPRNMAMTMSPP